jgi:hypothetical protein
LIDLGFTAPEQLRRWNIQGGQATPLRVSDGFACMPALQTPGT